MNIKPEVSDITRSQVAVVTLMFLSWLVLVFLLKVSWVYALLLNGIICGILIIWFDPVMVRVKISDKKLLEEIKHLHKENPQKLWELLVGVSDDQLRRIRRDSRITIQKPHVITDMAWPEILDLRLLKGPDAEVS